MYLPEESFFFNFFFLFVFLGAISQNITAIPPPGLIGDAHAGETVSGGFLTSFNQSYPYPGYHKMKASVTYTIQTTSNYEQFINVEENAIEGDVIAPVVIEAGVTEEVWFNVMKGSGISVSVKAVHSSSGLLKESFFQAVGMFNSTFYFVIYFTEFLQSLLTELIYSH